MSAAQSTSIPIFRRTLARKSRLVAKLSISRIRFLACPLTRKTAGTLLMRRVDSLTHGNGRTGLGPRCGSCSLTGNAGEHHLVAHPALHSLLAHPVISGLVAVNSRHSTLLRASIRACTTWQWLRRGPSRFLITRTLTRDAPSFEDHSQSRRRNVSTGDVSSWLSPAFSIPHRREIPGVRRAARTASRLGGTRAPWRARAGNSDESWLNGVSHPVFAEFAGEKVSPLLPCDSRLIRIGCEQHSFPASPCPAVPS